MIIKTIHLERFRAFRDETIECNRYTCFVGPNGAGKSTILSALNVFFRQQASATDTAKLTDEDYFRKDTSNPVRITITFAELGAAAEAELSAYARAGELVVTAEATYDPATGFGPVIHYGNRSGMPEFKRFFAMEKDGAKAADLNAVFDELRESFPDLNDQRSKDAKAEELRRYEAANPQRCELIRSQDQFYGVNSTGKLARFVQWVYVAAVKDAGEEGVESRDSALGRLMSRAVQTRTDLNEELEVLRAEASSKYVELLNRNQTGLTEISEALERRLADWAHPDVHVGLGWLSDPAKAVVLQHPVAGIKTGEGDFLGNLARMGHGLQRSYLFALLQELAASDLPNAATLILGCEEPELYQHPPQARHLSDVFQDLATGNNQMLVTTHSPIFVSGDGFENARLVQRSGPDGGAIVRGVTFEGVCNRVRIAKGEDQTRPFEGLIAKIYQALQPGIAEMLFARVPILVEGLEDVAYITAQMHLSGLWADYRRLGCHLIAVNGKDKLIQPLAIALELGLPAFVVFDADGGTVKAEHRVKHENDNKAILALLGVSSEPFPASELRGSNYEVWPSDIGEIVKQELGDRYAPILDNVRINYAQEAGLEKVGYFIVDWMTVAYDQGFTSRALGSLCDRIIAYGEAVKAHGTAQETTSTLDRHAAVIHGGTSVSKPA